MRPTRIVLHHSATPDGRTLSTAAIRRYHIQERGWQDIGYHVVIERVEDAVEGILGRPLGQPGAHAPGANSDSLGVCLVGDFDRAAPEHAFLRAAARIVAGAALAFAIPLDRIVGHRDVTAGRTCPGHFFSLGTFRALVGDAQRGLGA